MREKDVSNTPAFWLPQGNQCSLVLEQNLRLQPYPLEPLASPTGRGRKEGGRVVIWGREESS